MKIQAAVVHEPGGEIVLEEVQLDEPKANEVLIKMVGTGVCHTDLGVQAQHVKTPLPITLGHEGTGSSKKSVRASRNLNRAIMGVVEDDSVPKLFIPELIAYFKAGKFPFDKLVKRYPFKKLHEAINYMHAGKTIKPVITY